MYRIQEFLLCDEINPTITNLYSYKAQGGPQLGGADQASANQPAPHGAALLAPAQQSPRQAPSPAPESQNAVTFRFRGNFHWGTNDGANGNLQTPKL